MDPPTAVNSLGLYLTILLELAILGFAKNGSFCILNQFEQPATAGAAQRLTDVTNSGSKSDSNEL